MKRASVAELKARLSEYLAGAKRGEDVIVTDRGKPVARLTGLAGTTTFDDRLERAIRERLIRPPTAPFSHELLRAPLPNAPEGSVLKAILEEREEGR